MSEATADPVTSDTPQEEETEQSKYRSYYDETGVVAQAPQKFKKGRVVWFKTDYDGSYRMTIASASYDLGTNAWSYKLTDSLGDVHDGLVAETKLTAANPNK